MDELAIEWESFELEPTPAQRESHERAVAQFIAAGPELLDEATPYLWAYYRREWAAFTDEEREDSGIPEILESDDIWDHTEFFEGPMLTAGTNELEPAESYLTFSGSIPWEDEHGVALVFDEGRRLGKVGPDDGHVTNAMACGDASLLGVVLRS